MGIIDKTEWYVWKFRPPANRSPEGSTTGKNKRGFNRGGKAEMLHGSGDVPNQLWNDHGVGEVRPETGEPA